MNSETLLILLKMASEVTGRKGSVSRTADSDKGASKTGSGTGGTVSKCPDCKVKISESSEALMCEICENWFHIECQGITKTTYSLIGRNARSRNPNNHVHWLG